MDSPSPSAVPPPAGCATWLDYLIEMNLGLQDKSRASAELADLRSRAERCEKALRVGIEDLERARRGFARIKRWDAPLGPAIIGGNIAACDTALDKMRAALSEKGPADA